MNKAKYITDVPKDREEAIGVIESKRPKIIFVLGDIDTGKSTLITYLANKLIETFKIGIIDADIGQKGILPPTTISLTFPRDKFTSFSELKAEKSYFIGSTTPNQFFGEMVAGLKRLVDLSTQRADIILVDLTGYVHGQGAELKRLKIETVKPDLILALQRRNELENILKPFKNKIEIINLEVSKDAKIHEPSERRRIRREKWKAYFQNSKTYRLSLNDYIISGTQLFQGRELTKEELEMLGNLFKWLVFYGEKMGEKYIAVKADLEHYSRQIDKRVLHYIDFEKLSNLLVGLIDEDGFCIGVGILKLINFREKWIEVLAPLSEEEMKKVREIRFGRIRVREDGEELGLIDRGAI
ncbi:hypothetical protein PAP_00025 [Palaeococcus pacificus DY20341]|uniref:polynucleotide 5'-hydroxyl-kinase n=1 Tax=Palaeococcus pacificus DY20341 TaxID=1343739 RepID=A0A075LR52_9EURY|nr:Clp1/GlmU family protein [Palaeococcus pacificus]AIF68457.1 hypothetical protein PAP_00025 [Palaeococcus pacificus DY20341]